MVTPNFQFELDLNTKGRILFKEVIGLAIDKTKIRKSQGFITTRFQARNPVNKEIITLKNGLGNLTQELQKWLPSLRSAYVPQDIDIQLLNAQGESIQSWTLNQALPTRAAYRNTTDNQVAFDSIEFTCSSVSKH